MIVYVSRPVLWFACFPVLNMPVSGFFGGSCVSLATSRCHGVCFRITFYAVSALNFGAIPCKGYISTTECEHSPFSWKPCWKKNSDYFHGEQSETEKSWWQKCQSSEGPSVPVWAQHSGVFRFQTLCLLPGLCTMMVVVVVVVVVTTVAEVVVSAVVMMMAW